MAKNRTEPCVHYVCAGSCEFGRNASHFGYCQKCKQYQPRIKNKAINYKKLKLNKIKEREFLLENY